MSRVWGAPAALVAGGVLLLGCGQPSGANFRTVSGTVAAGPTCPAERVGSPCPSRPLQTTVLIVSRFGRVVASTRSDGQGRYVVRVAPGSYLVVVQTAVWPRCPMTRIVVDASRPTRANVLCDTGIR